jgi:hypothetical protein
MFNIHNSHLWAWDNPQAICKCGYQVCFSVSVWTGITGDMAMGPCTLPDNHDFLEIVPPELPEDVPLAVRQRLWFQCHEAPAYYVKDGQ